MTDIIHEAEQHLRQMSSHVRERKTAQVLERCVGELKRLREENERLKADAGRWRWVKENLRAGEFKWHLTIPACVGGFVYCNAASAVDAERTECELISPPNIERTSQ